MDDFLGGEFCTYGTKALEFTDWDWTVRFDPMIKVFPRLTKCTFHMYGSSGDVMKYDGMCILPINIIHEKIYVFLWFWFVILTVLSGVVIVYRAVLLLWPPARFYVLKSEARLANITYLEREGEENSKKLLVEYLSINLNNHSLFFNDCVAAEVMNFVNVVGQMFLIDMFLAWEFSRYGSKVLQFTEWDWSVRHDPMIKVFSRLTKCSFHMYGSSGDVQEHDAMCILIINIINEKIYVFLWFWFIILAIMSGVVLIYWALANKDYVERVCDRSKLGDWLVLDLLCKNIDPINFRDLMNEYVRRLDHKSLDNA
ncbi:putative innexin [Ixodes scapularis]